MQLHNIQSKTKRKRSHQVGRGGTRGKTSGRGTKGQNARAGRKKRPELRDFIKRFPKLRGRGVNSFKSFAIKPTSINLDVVEKVFKAGENVSATTLLEKKVLNKFKGVIPKVKILGSGEISKKLIFSGVEVSASAKGKIEKAGGSIK